MNELYFFLLMAISCTAPILAARQGKAALQCAALAIALSTTVIAGHLVTVFGLTASAGTATFVGLFLSVDLIAEIYGKTEALRTIAYTFLANIVLMLIGLTATQMSGTDVTDSATALGALFAWIPRLIAGGLIAFGASQVCDVLLFTALKRITSGRFLWFRTLASTMISQALDTILVWTIAFGGILPNLWQVILIAYVTKLFGALLEIPLCYAGRNANPDYNNARS